ncbi:WD40 repeat [Mycolicibacterium rutilum]|uniref:WD40 repeat n=2 Tax=Mycolicibacterium rutilum TaxID=370526 RepID=A0A1H6LRL0_MYCRU|nr:WD40 repeat [Mycolicibacterium rutilum]
MRDAVALKQWLVGQDPPLANEIFLDVDPESGLRTGTRWKDALRRANARCEAVICLLSTNWESSHECKVEYRTAENLNKQIFVARLEPSAGDELTSEWQRCDLFGDGPKTGIDIGDGEPVELLTAGLYLLRDGIRGAGIGAESFAWPPPNDPQRSPYRGWEPLDEADAAVFFGRDAQIVRAMDAVRGMRLSGVDSLFVVLGPSGTGKSSFLRAGLLPRLRREDRRFALLDIVRPERDVITGESGFAQAMCRTRARYGLPQPSLGEVKAACAAGEVGTVIRLLGELRAAAAARVPDDDEGSESAAAPTLVVPVDQAEELFTADGGESSEQFLRLLSGVIEEMNGAEAGIVVAATIRTDRYEAMQTHPLLSGLGTVLFDELKPMPPTQFQEVIVGPARRSTDGGRPLRVAPELVERLLVDAGEGADTLPMLALTLWRLFTDYGITGELTPAHYESLGGMRRVVQTEIDDVLAADPATRASQLASLRAAFIPWLATINPDNDQPLRRVARYTDLPGPGRPLIDALVAKRLMVKDTRGGEPVVEVALESLLRQWDELAGWLREERKSLKDADDLERAAHAWATNGHDPAWLLAGSRLSDAENLAVADGFQQRLTGTSDFLAASRAAENERLAAEEEQRQAELRTAQERQATAEAHAATLRKRSRILRSVLAVTAVVAVAAAVGFVRANAASNEATRQFREATGQRLNAEAQAMLADTQPGGDIRALQQLLAAHALTTAPDEGTLYDAVVQKAWTQRLIQTPGLVTGTAFSPDGRLLAASCSDDVVRIWDSDTGQPHGEPLRGHEEPVNDLSFSPDGKRLAASSVDGTVRVWDVASGRQSGDAFVGDAGANDEPAAVRSVHFASGGRELIVNTDDGKVRVFDAESHRVKGAPIANGADLVAVSSRGVIAANGRGAGDTAILMGSFGAPGATSRLDGHTKDVIDLAFSPDGAWLASTSADFTVRLWDVQAGRAAGEPLEGHTGEATEVAFSPDNRLLASGGADRTVRLWDVATGDPVGVPLTGPSGTVTTLAFDPSGTRLVAGSSDGSLRIWSMPAVIPLAGHTVAFSPDGKLAVGGIDGSLRLWDPATHEPVGEPFVGADGEMARLAFSADGERMVSVNAEGTLQVWEVASRRPLGAPVDVGADDTIIVALGIDPEARFAATGGQGSTVRLWDLQDGSAVGAAIEKPGLTTALAVREGGGEVLGTTQRSDGFGRLWRWNAESGEEISSEPLGLMSTATVSRSGAVAVGGDGDVVFHQPDEIEDDAEPVRGHPDPVSAIVFGPSDHRAVSGSRDGTVRLWDVATEEPIGKSYRGATGMVVSLAMSPDGRRFAAGGVDSTSRVWPATASPADLCAVLTGNMSQKQWDDWVSPDIDYIKTCPELPIAPD